MTISIIYSASNQDIKKNNGVIGALPFTPELAYEYFTFPGAEVIRNVVYKDPADSTNRTGVTIELAVKDLTKINESKALKDIKATFMKSDTGLVFSWFTSSNYITSGSIDTYQFIVNTPMEIKSTNGLLQGKEINWYMWGNKVDPRGYDLVTTIKSDSKTSEIKSSENNPPVVTDKTEPPKKRGCGPFGIELPLILLGGMILSINLRRKNK